MKNFKDIEFKPHPHGFGVQGILKVNGHTLSVVAGEGLYSEPRKNLKSPTAFDSFEVGIFNDRGDFVTNDFLPIGDDIAGWQTREMIDMILVRIQTLTIS